MNRLKFYLIVNAGFSGLSGLVLLLFSPGLQRFLGFSNDVILPGIGINLILFGIFVYMVVRKHLHNRVLVNLISTLDILWVLGSIWIVSTRKYGLSPEGYALISAVAVWVGFLAYSQLRFRPKLK